MGLEQWFSDFAPNAPYLAIIGILLATGFGLPMPEDIPLIIGGYLCGQAADAGDSHPALWLMMPGAMIAIVGSDLVLFSLGYWIGPSIQRHTIIKRLVGTRNLARTRVAFRKRGAKFIFFARFLPGVRAPAFFTAGTFKMPVTRFLIWDGAAACLSAPWVMLMGYHFHGEIEHARDALSKGKTFGFVIIVAIIVFFVCFHFFVNKRFAKAIPVKEEIESPADDEHDTPPTDKPDA